MAENSSPRPEEPGTEAYQQETPHFKAGRYAVKKFHLRGGMGEVWQAEDMDIGRLVALKRLRHGRSDQAARFLAEAQITGQLEHPGIVPVHDLGIDEENRPFYIMSFVSGRTFKDVIADYYSPKPSGLEPREVQRLRLLEAFVKVCQTVAYAHSKGVIHRDLKPDNVMLGPFGETVVLDWGLAKVRGRLDEPVPANYVQLSYGAALTATQYGTVIGAPPYMAPEEAEGKAAEADERTDVYLLGGTLYEILTGRAPRQGRSKDEMIELARTVPPVPPRQVNPQVAPALNAICMRALAQRKQDRYASAAELALEVQRHLAGEPVAAYPESPPARAWRWCKQHRRALVRSGAAVLVLALVGAGLTLLDAANRQRRDAVEKQGRAELEATEVRDREQAGVQVKRFRRLADEIHFQAANLDGLNEKVPYYDPAKGNNAGKEALAIARSWGPQLADLPLPEQWPTLKAELYGVLLLLAQPQTERPPAVKEFLDWAEAVGGSSRSLHRLRAEYYDRLLDRKNAARERSLAADPRTPSTALDDFLQGEKHRVDATMPRGNGADLSWRPNVAQLKDAVAKYRAVLARQPNHYWANLQLGRCLLSLGRSDEAVMALGACVALRPAAPWGWSTRGLAQTVRAQFDEAKRDLDKALALDAKFEPALLNRGALRWQQGQLDKALIDFEAVTVAEGGYYRGLVLLEQRENAAALKEFGRLATLQPTFAPVHLVRACACFALGDNQEGLDALDSYLARMQRFDAHSPEAFATRGKLLRRLMAREKVSDTRKRLGQLALQQLREAEQRGVESADLYRELGALFDSPKQAKLAIKYYARGLEIAPGNARLHLSRGAAYAQHFKDYKSARADLARAATVADGDPDSRIIRSEANSWLGFVYARQKATAEAQAAASLAMLYAHDDDGRESYLIIHNVACIFAELSLTDPDRAETHQHSCLAHLERAVALWRRVGKGPNEVDLIKGDPSFRSLRGLPKYQKLVAPQP